MREKITSEQTQDLRDGDFPSTFQVVWGTGISRSQTWSKDWTAMMRCQCRPWVPRVELTTLLFEEKRINWCEANVDPWRWERVGCAIFWRKNINFSKPKSTLYAVSRVDDDIFWRKNINFRWRIDQCQNDRVVPEFWPMTWNRPQMLRIEFWWWSRSGRWGTSWSSWKCW